ncbi:uncharacterized protein P174DRAFT_418610 [Aspergillus novofumigatus IBT 16806]|uniref:SNF2 N-terminal domain-containing protein n=1 Tax=Aspergillus novofumigatus (strain IBT 16806) TaxID=1392255 RepID=A0A2I1CJ91_ASPN1|nr:uncharacterized protein P174DRAFT_418610 [Aspergillus novofumigatus IBT 16806]PKX97667.1 hypothetical protein P174DRAFT_418610 [Aspergillus novofumigatus IBT 16806]
MFLISQDRREIFITEGANRSTFHILLPIHSGKSGLKARVRAVGGPLPRGAPPASAPARPPSPTHLSGWFGRVVCDEGHAAKTIRTRVRQSVARLEAEHVWFFTATPLYNQAFNLCGYLAIFYSGLRRAGVMQEGGDNSKVNWFPEYKQLADQAMLPSRSPDDGVGMFTETIIWVALEKAVASRHAAMKTLLDHMENKAGNGCVPIVTPPRHSLP